MIVEERRSRLLEVVRQRGFAALNDLAEELAVSESTVRRDLEILEESGSAKRMHGGVVYTGASPKLPHFDQRQSLNWEKKRQIAHAASSIIEDGDTVLLDGGTTTYELAQLLVGRPLQVVTNSLPVANLFTAATDTDLVLIGGYLHQRTGVMIGPVTRHVLSELRVRRAMLSVASISDNGFFNSNLLIIEAQKAMMQAADEIVILADSTKFGFQSLSHICDLGDVHKLVVDADISDGWKQKTTTAGIELLVADEPSPPDAPSI